jgi:small basic protein
MQIVFITVAIVGLFFFLFAKRQFDFFSIGFFSACIYFLPGFFGYALMPIASIFIPVELVPETYLVMIVVLGAILLLAIVLDSTVKTYCPNVTIRGSEGSAVWALVIALFGFIMSVITTGDMLLSSDKSIMMEQMNRWYILWVTGASLGAVLSFLRARWGLFFFSMLLLLADVYIGFRFSLAVTLIAIFTLWLKNKGEQRLAVDNWKIGVLASMAVLFFFIYKFIFISVKLGEWDTVIERLMEPKFYVSTLISSEPFTTQLILNEVITRHFFVGMSHFSDIIYQFMLFSPEIGMKVVSFNDLFQPSFFPGIKWGMANNIWAEMLSSGGWSLLMFFLACFVLLLALGSYSLRSTDPEFTAGCSLLFSYWAFYIHRNDLIFQINLEKRALLIWAACIALSHLFYEVGQKNKRILNP